ncbi:LAMI_0F01706g1_1 [Lachancea mirantina]|uniref:LAMI_0F01706g1_1 n=1 Tax=Lachancea mirantina TaxID=1230905 RepID=A0A1G4JW82_9SACH|nr:LAMI_0F01706g1_1 [Lachancea mirantina]
MDKWAGDSSSEDDDLLEQLSCRPPKESSACLPQSRPETNNTDVLKKLALLEEKLLTAQGEASILRGRLEITRLENETEHKKQTEKAREQSNLHQQEIEKLKIELQRAEDEKKFSAMTEKLKPRHMGGATNSSNITPDSSVNSTKVSVKRRKVEDSPKVELASLKQHHVVTDEVSDFYDVLITHRLPGSDLTTMEILNQIRLEFVGPLKFKSLSISSEISIGRSIFGMLAELKKRSIKLDGMIDVVLESLAVLIKEISHNEKECRTAVPFLVALMFQTITFRPSAVRETALKDIFMFGSDLIRVNRHVLKKPLHRTVHDLGVGPPTFQYEFIDILVVLYSFDILERTLKILQTQSAQASAAFVDESFLKALDDLMRYSLSISHQPVFNVIYNSVEMLNCITSIVLENLQIRDKIKLEWWINASRRTINIFERKAVNVYSTDSKNSCLYLSKDTNIYGLIRHMGDNHNGAYLSKLVSKDTVQSIPEVIMKDFEDDDDLCEFTVDVEWWSIRLKKSILKCFEKLLLIYDRLGNEQELFISCARQLAIQQETLLTVLAGRDSENIVTHCEFISQCVEFIYSIWKRGQCEPLQVKEVESELTVALWRIVFGTSSRENLLEVEGDGYKDLVDRIHQFEISDDQDFFVDAFDGHLPDFITRELEQGSNVRSYEITTLGIEEHVKGMAKAMLEEMTSMEDADDLYMAMVQEPEALIPQNA